VSQVNWDGPERITRLSAFASSLLMHLCIRGADLEFERQTGSYWLCVKGVRYQRMRAPNVEVLLRPRLIMRLPGSGVPHYTITAKGRELMRQRADASDGCGCVMCREHECPFAER
jgi:hypothetical protein